MSVSNRMGNPNPGENSEEESHVNSPNRQGKEQHREAQQEAATYDKQAELAKAMGDGELQAEQAGRMAARKLGEGFLQGLGRRAAEMVWDALTGKHGS